MCTVGIMLPSLMSLAIPADPVKALNDNPDDFMITGYWRIIWLAGALLVLLQMALLATVFNYETPVSMKQNGEHDRLIELMRKKNTHGDQSNPRHSLSCHHVVCDLYRKRHPR